MPEQVRTDLALFEGAEENAIHSASEKPGQARLAHAEWQLPDIVTVAHEHVEGVELHFLVVPARVKAIEIRYAIYAEQHGFTINHKRVQAISQGSLYNEREAVAPIVPFAVE